MIDILIIFRICQFIGVSCPGLIFWLIFNNPDSYYKKYDVPWIITVVLTSIQALCIPAVIILGIKIYY